MVIRYWKVIDMKIPKKLFVFILFLLVSIPLNYAYAAEPLLQAQDLQNDGCTVNSAVPYADQIVMKTRWHNGVLQYRRWNKTKNCWDDPEWINAT